MMIRYLYFTEVLFLTFQYGDTAVSFECIYGYVEVVRLLLTHNDIDVNIKDNVRND
jgi:hypothetical protein